MAKKQIQSKLESFTPYKVFFLLNYALVFFLLVLLFLSPSTNKDAIYAYGWFFVGWAAFFAADLLLFGFPYSELIDTISFEIDPERHILQLPFGLAKTANGLKVYFVIIIAIGLLWGTFYAYQVATSRTLYISIPVLFAASPAFGTTVTQQIFDIIESSWMVATVEESIWIGLMFPIIWGLLTLAILPLIKVEFFAAIISLVISALIVGFLVSFLFHSFVYGSGSLIAFDRAQTHFTVSAFITGITGSTIPSIIAHAMHNAVAKIVFVQGVFTALPLEAYQIQQQQAMQQEAIATAGG